ncbi:hypothetical protein AX769_17520 [Frondihabitans sp. PAMC 28766]|nr:hypothetical protein AX769_17520 [Frondihabitans sp. PAMC 28766]
MPVVLGAIALVLLVLALLGLPLIPLPSRSGNDHQFATFGTEFARWRQYHGWRYTSDSWVYWAGFAACLFGVVLWWRQVRGFTKRYALVLVPAAAVLALGPLVQSAVGLKSSDYASRVAFGGNVALSAVVVVGLFVLFYFTERLRRYFRAAGRAGGSVGSR